MDCSFDKVNLYLKDAGFNIDGCTTLILSRCPNCSPTFIFYGRSYIKEIPFSAYTLRNGNRDGDGSADHGVVAHAEKAHHFNMSRNGAGARELRV